MEPDRIVVVGASLAGLRAATTLRDEGFSGALVVIGEESRMPYERPPLSKQVLSGDWEWERATLPLDADLLRAQWRLGQRAIRLDVAQRRVHLDDGSSEHFDGLVIATGATPMTLGTSPLSGVHTLRTVDDALALRASLDRTTGRVVVVGGGFIGSEVAATCRQRGREVTIVEALAAPMGRALGTEVGSLIAAIHRSHGVEVRTAVAVTDLIGVADVERVALSDGTEIAADVVVVAVGVRPATDWLEGSGLDLEDGVVCDETCHVAPGIVAAGDVARWPNRRLGEVRRIEHWDNAIRQAEHAARRLLAGSASATSSPYDPVPWVWSDQYDRKLQMVGSPLPDDEVRIVASSSDPRRVVAFYRRENRLIAAFAINRARQVMALRTLIGEHASWDDAAAAIEAAAA